MFDTLSESDQNFINRFMSAPTETASTRGAITSEGATPEVMSIEVLAVVPTTPMSLGPKPTPMREVPKPKKYR